MDNIKDYYGCGDCCTGCKDDCEEYIVFRCEKCGDFYCFQCFCRNHYGIHSDWDIYIIKEGIPIPLVTDITLKKF